MSSSRTEKKQEVTSEFKTSLFEFEGSSRPMPDCTMDQEFIDLFERGAGSDDINEAQKYLFFANVVTGKVCLIPVKRIKKTDDREKKPLIDKHGKPFRQYVCLDEKIDLSSFPRIEWELAFLNQTLVSGEIVKGKNHTILVFNPVSIINQESIEFSPELIEKLRIESDFSEIKIAEEKLCSSLPTEVSVKLRNYFIHKLPKSIDQSKDDIPFDYSENTLEKQWDTEIKKTIQNRPLNQLIKLFPHSLSEDEKDLLLIKNENGFSPIMQCIFLVYKKIRSKDDSYLNDIEILNWLIKEKQYDLRDDFNISGKNVVDRLLKLEEKLQYDPEIAKLFDKKAKESILKELFPISDQKLIYENLIKGDLNALRKQNPDIIRNNVNKSDSLHVTPLTHAIRRLSKLGTNYETISYEIEFIKWLTTQDADVTHKDDLGREPYSEFISYIRHLVSQNTFESIRIAIHIYQQIPTIKVNIGEIFYNFLRKNLISDAEIIQFIKDNQLNQQIIQEMTDCFFKSRERDTCLSLYKYFSTYLPGFIDQFHDQFLSRNSLENQLLFISLLHASDNAQLKVELQKKILTNLVSKPEEIIKLTPDICKKLFALTDADGNGLLHFAARHAPDEKTIQLLLEKKANPLKKNAAGKLPSELPDIKPELKLFLAKCEKSTFDKREQKALEKRLHEKRLAELYASWAEEDKRKQEQERITSDGNQQVETKRSIFEPAPSPLDKKNVGADNELKDLKDPIEICKNALKKIKEVFAFGSDNISAINRNRNHFFDTITVSPELLSRSKDSTHSFLALTDIPQKQFVNTLLTYKIMLDREYRIDLINQLERKVDIKESALTKYSQNYLISCYDSYVRARDSAKSGCGRCAELASFVFIYLMQKITEFKKIELVNAGDDDHAFIVINRSSTDHQFTLRDLEKDKNMIVIDPWCMKIAKHNEIVKLWQNFSVRNAETQFDAKGYQIRKEYTEMDAFTSKDQIQLNPNKVRLNRLIDSDMYQYFTANGALEKCKQYEDSVKSELDKRHQFQSNKSFRQGL